MEKRTPKRKSLANTNTTPTKIQKTGNTPNKNNKSPKAGKKSPQKKQFNGKQNTPKEKKQIKAEDEEGEDFLNESEENETEDSLVQMKEEMNGNSDNSDAEDGSDEEEEDDDDEDEDDDDDDDDEDEETESKPQVKSEKDKSEVDRKFSLFVGGLDFKTKEAEIRSLFDKDSILSVNLLINKFTKKSRGCAFVNFKNEAAMKKGLSKNGANLKGRTVKVSVPQKVNKDEKKRVILEKLKLKVKKLEQELAGETKPASNKKFNKKGKKANK